MWGYIYIRYVHKILFQDTSPKSAFRNKFTRILSQLVLENCSITIFTKQLKIGNICGNPQKFCEWAANMPKKYPAQNRFLVSNS